MSNDNKKLINIIGYFILSVSLLIIFLLTVFPVDNTDIWWHLKTGEVILKTFSMPEKDIFSYTAGNGTWTHHEWLFEIILYPVYAVSGFNGLIFLKSLIIMLMFFFLIRSSLTVNKNLIVLGLYLVFIGYFIKERFDLRPDVFTLLFTAIDVYVLFLYKYKNKNLLYILAIVQLLWVNSHGAFVVGGALIMLFITGELITWLFKKEVGAKKRFVDFFTVGVIMAAACLINPITYRIFIFPFEQLTVKSAFMKNIIEWASPFHPFFNGSPVLKFYVFWLLLSFASFVFTFKKLDIPSFLAWLFFTALSATGIRYVAIAFVLTFPMIMRNFSFIYDHLSAEIKKLVRDEKDSKVRLFNRAVAGFAALAFVFFLAVLSGEVIKTITGKIGLGGGKDVPSASAGYVIKNNIKGNLFNSFENGGYLLFRFYPERLVYIDTRANIVYDGGFFLEYREALKDHAVLQKIIGKYGINYFILDYYPQDQVTGKNPPIHKYLSESKDWSEVFFDDKTIVYVKNGDEFSGLVKRDGYSAVNPALFDFSKLEDTAFCADSIKEYNRAITADPGCTNAYNQLARVYIKTGNYREALTSLKKSLELKPDNISTIVLMSSVYYSVKSYEDAAALLKKAIGLNPEIPDFHINLASVYIEMKMYGKAIAEFKKALRINPDDPSAGDIKKTIDYLKSQK